eukprot:jgi/Ulvmu1/8884/UM049_0066.1
MSNLKAAVGEKEAAIIRKRLNTWAKSCNPTCADCSRTNPTWASVNLGVLVCLECAGRHRSLGTHISKMRSITLDTVLPEEAHFLLQMTNELANRYWEARLPSSDRAQAVSQASFILQKYTDRRWVMQDPAVPVPSRECVPQAHPWWNARDTCSAPDASRAADAAPACVPLPPPATGKPVLSLGTASQKSPKPVVEATDLIDFGDAPAVPGVPEPGPTSTETDPFSSSHAPTSAPLSSNKPSSGDPFAAATTAASAPPAAPQVTPAQPPAAPVDPFAALSLGETPQGHPSPINHVASAPVLPVHSGTVQYSVQGGSPGQHSRTGSVSSVMSAPTDSSKFSAQAASSPAQPTMTNSPRQTARKPQSKAEMNAHILSLYNRPSSTSGAMPSMTTGQQGGMPMGQQPGVGVSWANPAHAFAARPQPPTAAGMPPTRHPMPGYGSPAQPR